MPESKLLAALHAFQESDVQFILVGGVAAVLNGAPVQTFDIDLVYAVEPANIDRLLPVLERLDAIFRIQPERHLRPTRSHLAGGGHLNLLTRFGPVDLLGSIGQNLRYPDLLPHSHDLDIGEGVNIRVLNLEMLIAVKERVAGEKDIAVLPILRRTLSEIRKKDQSR